MPVKPGPWRPNRSAVDPQFQRLWDDLRVLTPFWDRGTTLMIPEHGVSTSDLGGPYWVHPAVTSNPILQPKQAGMGLTFDETDDFIEYELSIHRTGWYVHAGSGLLGDFSVVAVLETGQVGGTAFQYFISNNTAQEPDSFNLFFAETGSSDDDFAISMDSGIIYAGDPAGNRREVQPNTTYVVCVRRDVAGNTQFAVNGELGLWSGSSASTLAGDDFEGSNQIEYGRRADANTDRYFGGTLHMVAKWDRALSDAEFALISRDPFGMIRPAPWPGYPSITGATVQYLYPDGDLLSGGWETAPTAGQPLSDQIDEDPAVDSDYIFEEV